MPSTFHAVSLVLADGTIEIDENLVTPGVAGFFAILFVGVVTLLLCLDMARRVRRTHHRGEIRERLEVEVAERDADQTPDAAEPAATERPDRRD